MNTYELGILFEAYIRFKKGEPISDSESTVTFRGNSGLVRKELTKKGYLIEKEKDGKIFFEITEKGIKVIIREVIPDLVRMIKNF